MPVVEHLRVEGGVVAGDDGSEEAAAALLWAAETASYRRAPLRVVRAWSMRSAPRPKDWSVGYVPPLEEFEVACRETVERDVFGALEQWQGLDARVHVVHGEPVRVLREAAEGADLLVIGWRGRGLRDRILGSVAEEMLRSAGCAVVVVRPFRP